MHLIREYVYKNNDYSRHKSLFSKLSVRKASCYNLTYPQKEQTILRFGFCPDIVNRSLCRATPFLHCRAYCLKRLH